MNAPSESLPMPRGRRGKARVAILTILDEEFEAVRAALELTTFLNGYGYRAGESVLTPDVVVYQTSGRFNLAANGAVTNIVRDYLPDNLLVVGIAGGVAARGVELGDLVVPYFVHYSELAKHVDDAVSWRYVPYDQPSIRILGEPGRDVMREGRWVERVTAERPRAGQVGIHYGENIIAGEKIWGNLDDHAQRRMLERFDDAVAVETESAGVARAVFTSRCELGHNVEYAVIRGVSDLVDVRANQRTRELWRQYAADVAATYARELCLELMKREQEPGVLPVELV